MSKIDSSLFSASAQALEQAFGQCPKCSAALAIKHGRAGPFLGCVTYPICDYSQPLQENEQRLIQLIPDSACPKCQQPLAIKQGRFGMFVGCSDFPACDHIQTLKQSEKTEVSCPSCGKGALVKRSNKFGKSFFACDSFPACKYAVNFTPVQQACPKCQWPIMVEKLKGQDKLWVCPQRQCQHKINSEA